MKQYLNLALAVPLTAISFSSSTAITQPVSLESEIAFIGDKVVQKVNNTSQARTRRERGKRRNNHQVVYLNFENIGAPTFPVFAADPTIFSFDTEDFELFGVFPDYVFTPRDRRDIQNRLEADFGQFNISFVQQKPESGDFTTLSFSDNDDSAIFFDEESRFLSFGAAFFDFDFFNQNKNDNGVIDITFLQFLAQVDPSGDFFAEETNAPIETTLDDALRVAVVNRASNIAGSALSQLMGISFLDSIGAVGEGIPDFISRSDFIPAYTGPQNATETDLHFVGLDVSDLSAINEDLFLSERSSLKLSIAERISSGRFKILDEERANSSSVQDIRLRKVPVPNTIVTGQNKGVELKGKAAVISASLEGFDEIDQYSFNAKAGDIITVEFTSDFVENTELSDDELIDDDFFPDLNPDVLGNLSLSFVHPDGTLVEVASNLSNFVTLEAFLLDVNLPFTGKYILKVDAPDTFFEPDFDPNDFSIIFTPASLASAGLSELRTGDYNLVIYQIDAVQ